MGRREINVQVTGPPPMPPEGYSYRSVPETHRCPVCKGRKHLYVGGVWVGKDQACPTCSGTGVLVEPRYELVPVARYVPPTYPIQPPLRRGRSGWAIVGSAIFVLILIVVFLYARNVYFMTHP